VPLTGFHTLLAVCSSPDLWRHISATKRPWACPLQSLFPSKRVWPLNHTCSPALWVRCKRPSMRSLPWTPEPCSLRRAGPSKRCFLHDAGADTLLGFSPLRPSLRPYPPSQAGPSYALCASDLAKRPTPGALESHCRRFGRAPQSRPTSLVFSTFSSDLRVRQTG
jgi:hypothetical protein